MKILHTSDWHLGAGLCGFARLEEQRSMLEQIREIAFKEHPDALLVSGDIFDTSNPGAEAMRLLSDSLLTIHEQAPAMPVVLISGNHDSASRHEVFKGPWEKLNIHVFGTLDGEDVSRNIVKLAGVGLIVAVPHYRAYGDSWTLPRIMEEVAKVNQERLPVVLMAHLAVNGCDFRGHDHNKNIRETVGGLDCQKLTELGTGYDYCALGHIHRAQTLHGSHGRARYCGTPICMSFDELPGNHTVTIVEMSSHGAKPKVREVEVKADYDVVNLPLGEPRDWDTVKALAEAFSPSKPTYLRLRVSSTLAQVPPDYDKQMRDIFAADDKQQVRYCYTQLRRQDPGETGAEGGVQIETIDQFDSLTPEDIARTAYDEGQFTPELAQLLREAIASLDAQQQQ